MCIRDRVDGHLELGLELCGERIGKQKASGDDEEKGCVFHGYILMRMRLHVNTLAPLRAGDDRHYQ